MSEEIINLDALVSRLEALDSTPRLRLLVLLLNEGAIHPEAASMATGMSSALCGSHLSQLYHKGFATRSRNGRYLVYIPVPAIIEQTITELKQLLERKPS